VLLEPFLTHPYYIDAIHLQDHISPPYPPTLISHTPRLDPHNDDPTHSFGTGLGHNIQPQSAFALVECDGEQVAFNLWEFCSEIGVLLLINSPGVMVGVVW
jgi:hypothetical protein